MIILNDGQTFSKTHKEKYNDSNNIIIDNDENGDDL